MLKRHNQMMATFSMASMTDVIFLLLIFFMVTSTFVFPTGLDVKLPQSAQQSAVKPLTRVYIDAQENLFAATGADQEPQPLGMDALVPFLKMALEQDTTGYVAVFADHEVPYGRVVEVLAAGAQHNLRMVLATRPASRQ